MDTAGSITSPSPIHVRVAKEFWSVCLTSRLLASFLNNASDLCYLSTCCRAFVPFRTQIWQVKHKNHEHSNFAEAISSGRLPCLRALDLSHLYVKSKLDISLLSTLLAGQVPSLRDLRLRVWSIEDDAAPTMLRLMALSHLERLHLNCSFYRIGAVNSIWDAAKKYPRLTVYVNQSTRKERSGGAA